MQFEITGQPTGFERMALVNGARAGRKDLRGANLRWADLCWANLRGADLRGADLYVGNIRVVPV